MGKAKFTEGPWSFAARLTASENHRGFGLFVKHGRLYLGDIMPLDEDGEEGRANANLIAAAPDLYEALQDMLSGWRYIREAHGDLYGVGWDRAESAASAALAKARGES